MPHAPDSPVRLSRTAGALFLLMAAGGIFGAMVVRQGVIGADAATTAQRILADEVFFRAGVLGDLVAFLCDVAVSILLYVLLRPAGATLALLSTSFRLVYTAAVGANLKGHLDAVLLLKGLGPDSGFTTAQVEALAHQALQTHQVGYSLALVFFAFHLLLLGVQLWRSDAFPRWLGVLVGAGGVAYVVDGVLLVLAPETRAAVTPYLALPMSFELVLAVWMLIFGVRRAHVAV